MAVLPEKGIKSISEFIRIEDTSWSTALAVCTTDLPGKRRRGSTWCKFLYFYRFKKISLLNIFFLCLGGGWAGTSYLMDPTTGIAVVYGVQLTPPGDVEGYKVAFQLESVLYQGLKVVV